jgi:hypothetical protein
MNNWNGLVKCVRCSNNGHLTKGKIYKIKDNVLTTDNGAKIIYKDIDDMNKHTLINLFEEVEMDKVKILLKDNFEIEFNNKKYLIHKWTNYAKLRITQNGNIEHEIRWGESFNTTLADIQPILDTLNIEIVEEQPKYKIDIEGEYTEEELEVIKKVGIKFKKVGD